MDLWRTRWRCQSFLSDGAIPLGLTFPGYSYIIFPKSSGRDVYEKWLGPGGSPGDPGGGRGNFGDGLLDRQDPPEKEAPVTVKESRHRGGPGHQGQAGKISEDIDETDTGTREYTYRGVYEYEVDGQTKRHRVISKRTLPYVFLYLYYTDTPKKVFSDYDNLETGYSTACLLGIGALLLTMYLTGYITF